MTIPTYEFALCLDDGVNDESDVVNVEDITLFGVPPQPWTWSWGQDRYIAGNGKVYYDGFPQATWTFKYLTSAAWSNLMALFDASGPQSVNVFLRTKRDDGLYATQAAIMHRPEIGADARRGVGGFFDVILRFVILSAGV